MVFLHNNISGVESDEEGVDVDVNGRLKHLRYENVKTTGKSRKCSNRNQNTSVESVTADPQMKISKYLTIEGNKGQSDRVQHHVAEEDVDLEKTNCDVENIGDVCEHIDTLSNVNDMNFSSRSEKRGCSTPRRGSLDSSAGNSTPKCDKVLAADTPKGDYGLSYRQRQLKYVTYGLRSKSMKPSAMCV